MNHIQTIQNQINVNGVVVTQNALEIGENVTLEELKPVLGYVKTVASANAWWVADLAIAYQQRTGRDYSAEVAEVCGLDANLIRHYKRTGEAFPPGKRRNLSFKHHLTALQECGNRDDAGPWLDRAETEELSAVQMRRTIRKTNQVYNDESKPDGETIADLVKANMFAKRQIARIDEISADWAQNLLGHCNYLKEMIEKLEKKTNAN